MFFDYILDIMAFFVTKSHWQKSHLLKSLCSNDNFQQIHEKFSLSIMLTFMLKPFPCSMHFFWVLSRFLIRSWNPQIIQRRKFYQRYNLIKDDYWCRQLLGSLGFVYILKIKIQVVMMSIKFENAFSNQLHLLLIKFSISYQVSSLQNYNNTTFRTFLPALTCL